MKETLKMRKVLLAIALFVFTVSARIIYVDPMADCGDGCTGGSWEYALPDIQWAIDRGNSHFMETGELVEVWVAQGEVPYLSGPYEIKSGVALYGGFKGNLNEVKESSKDQRVPGEKTIISGDIGTPEVIEDNLSKLFYENLNTSDSLIVDGFEFRDAYVTSSGDGALTIDAVNAKISNCLFRNNIIPVDGGGSAGNGGAGLRVNQSNNGNHNWQRVEVENCQFINNKSNYGAAAFYVRASSFISVKNSIFYDNVNGYSSRPTNYPNDVGGAFLEDVDSIVIDGCHFKNNSGTRVGALSANDFFVSGNMKIINSTFESNSGIEHGAVFYDADSLTVSSSKFVFNKTNSRNDDVDTAKGAAIYFSGKKIKSDKTLYFQNVVFQLETGTKSLIEQRNGGALCLKVDTCIMNSDTLRGNSAYNGGALFLENSGESTYLHVQNSIIENNSSYYGGGIFIGDTLNNDYGEGRIKIVGSSFSNNLSFSSSGGALYCKGKFNLAINSSDFRDNLCDGVAAPLKNGAAVYFQGWGGNDTCTVTSSRFVNNKADDHGGAIYCAAEMLIIDTCVFDSNQCRKSGGALNFIGTDCFIANSDFGKNQSTYDGMGGAVIIEAMSSKISDVVFSENSCYYWGGALRASHNNKIQLPDSSGEFRAEIPKDSQLLAIESCRFEQNNAKGNGTGGAVSLFNWVASITYSVFSNDTAKYGGALEVVGDSLYIKRCTFAENKSLEGGAIIWTSKGLIENCLFNRNFATYGGAISIWTRNLPNYPFTVEEQIERNRSAIINSVYFSGNASDNEASVIRHWSGLIINSLFYDNKHTGSAANSYILGNPEFGGPSIINTTIAYNIAEGDYSGVRRAISNCNGEILNTIVWNPSHGAAEEIGNSVEPTFSIIRNYSGTNSTVKNVDPQLKRPESDNYSLGFSSPAINAGDTITWSNVHGKFGYLPNTDLAGNDRHSGSIIDIGAYERQLENIIPIVNNVKDNCNGSFTATFGYNNPNSIPLITNYYWGGQGPMNYIYQDGKLLHGSGYGNPTHFEAGIQEDVFSITFKDSVSWHIASPADTLSDTAWSDMATNSCASPQITANLKTLEVSARDTLILDLNKKSGNEGFFVTYGENDITKLNWDILKNDNSHPVELLIEPGSNKLYVIPSWNYGTGDKFSFTVRVSDPNDAELADTQMVYCTVVNGGFDVRNLVIKQDALGIFKGEFEARRNINPLELSRERLLLYNSGGIEPFNKQFINPIVVNEDIAPASQGGDSEWGKYSFSFNGSAITVFNPNGSNSGNTLKDWLLNKKDQSIVSFLVLITDKESAKTFKVDTKVDFSGPFPSFMDVVENYPHSQKVIWGNFDEKLIALKLKATALGDTAPAPTEVIYNPDEWNTIKEQVFEGLEDSREYKYELIATDIYNNTQTSEAFETTPSDTYSISGVVTGVYEEVPEGIKVSLYSVASTGFGSKGFLKETKAVKVGEPFIFSKLPNHKYSVTVEANNYHGVPAGRSVTILRRSVTGVDFELVADPVVNKDGVKIVQEEGTGDLIVFAHTNFIFDTERPVSLILKWQTGFPVTASGEQEFNISNHEVIPKDSVSDIWKIRITREEIRSHILSRTSSFDEDIRYINAVIKTSTDNFEDFRMAHWDWPTQSGDQNSVSFAPQSFKRLKKPVVSGLAFSMEDANFKVKNENAGLSIDAVSQLIRKDIYNQPIDTTIIETPLSNISRSIIYSQKLKNVTWLFRHFDFNKSLKVTSDDDGEQLVRSVYDVEDQTGFIKKASNSVSLKNTISNTYQVEVGEKGLYDLYFYIPELTEEEAVIDLTIKSGTLQTSTAFRVNEPGWSNAVSMVIDSGIAEVKVSVSSPAISLSGFILINDYDRRKDTYQNLGHYFDVLDGMKDLFHKYPNDYHYGIQRGVEFSSLPSDQTYDLRVFSKDRYGNLSDTVVINNVQTKPNAFTGKFSLSQENESGDLNIVVAPLSSKFTDDYGMLKSVTFNFGGKKFPFEVNAEIENDMPTIVKIEKESLPNELLNIEGFKRHTNYSNIELVLSNMEIIRDTILDTFKIRDICDSCNYSELNSVKWYNAFASIFGGKLKGVNGTNECLKQYNAIFFGTTSKCLYTEIIADTNWIDSKPFIIDFPEAGGNRVASQEYRKPTNASPVYDDVKARTIKISVDNLNTLADGGAKQQMAGTLYTRWIPGSLCQEFTEDTISFGTYHRLNDNGWISFMPSFEASISSQTAKWLEDASGNGATFQWIDNFTTENPELGGSFFPNVGYTVPASMITTSYASVPKISTGIYLDTLEASADGSLGERFKLWVLPSANNGETSRHFYWGIDGTPVAQGDAFDNDGSFQWLSGPEVTLTPGKHTIDIFMIDDGVNIGGIALSKTDASAPTMAISDLERWGDYGFELDIEAIDLMPNSNHAFSYVVVDRMGNISDTIIDTVKTEDVVKPVPNVTITPGESLENGYYHSIYPIFSLALDGADENELTIETRLVKTDAGVEYEITTGFDVVKAESENYWTLVVDSTGVGLEEFPVAANLSTADNYKIYAQVSRNSEEKSNWTTLFFGVRAAENEVPVSVSIQDPLYTLPDNIRMTYIKGFETGPNTVVGDLQILFDDGIASSGQQLLLEGATITTTVDGSGNHISINTVTGGFLTAYNYDGLYDQSSKKSVFALNYGRYKVEATVDSLLIAERTPGSGSYVILSEEMSIFDDLGNPARLSGNIDFDAPNMFTSAGIADNMYATKDVFFCKDVMTYSDVAPGFSLKSCRTTFIVDTTGSDDDYTMILTGSCDNCGPYLDFSVISPKYLEDEFHRHDELEQAMKLDYTSNDESYVIDWSYCEDSKNNALVSYYTKDDNVSYRDWEIALYEYEFNSTGVHIKNMDIWAPVAVFPKEKNQKDDASPDFRQITGFSGISIIGNERVNNGALHFNGVATTSMLESFGMTTAGNYKFKAIPQINFVPVTDGVDYNVIFPGGCTLELPVGKSDDFNEDDNIDISVSKFTLGNDNILELEASGDFNRTVGIMEGTAPGLYVDGTISVTWAARDFQLDLQPIGSDEPLLTLNGGFFREYDDNEVFGFSDPSAPIGITKSSMGLFSDFTINTLYGTQQFSSPNFAVTPLQFDLLTFPTETGFDIVKTDAGLQLWLLAPQYDLLKGLPIDFELGNDEIPDCDVVPSISNVSFDLNRNLIGVNGKVDLPEDLFKCITGKSSIISEKLLDIDLNTIYLGYDKSETDEKFTIGADASFTFGSLFKKIGLDGEKVRLNNTAVSYSPVNKDWKLEELHARAFDLPRKLQITANNFDEARTKDSVFVEFSTGGKGFSLDYVNNSDDPNLNKVDMAFKNWQISVGDQFPIEAFRGASFILDSLRYQKSLNADNADGKIVGFGARGEYVPPNGRAEIGEFGLAGVKFTVGTHSDEDVENKSGLNAYFRVGFDTLIVASKPYIMSDSYFRVYFDGRWEFNGNLIWKDTVAIVPWMAESNPDIFIDPGKEGAKVGFKLASNAPAVLTMENVHLKSKNKLAIIDTTLHVELDKFALTISKGKPEITKLDLAWHLNKRVINEDMVEVMIPSIQIGYGVAPPKEYVSETAFDKPFDDHFWMIGTASIKFGKKTSRCEGGGKGAIGFTYNTKSTDDNEKPDFLWSVNDVGVSCELGGFEFGGKLTIQKEKIGLSKAWLNMDLLDDYDMLEKDNDVKIDPDLQEKMKVGVAFKNVYWEKVGSDWEFNHSDQMEVIPTFELRKPLDILGLKLYGTFDFSKIFSDNPRIGYKNIDLQLSKNLGNAKISLPLSLYVDGHKPYFHPELDEPNKISLSLGGLQLTDDMKLGDALMEFGVEQVSYGDESYEAWYFRGMASLSLEGALEEATVDIALEKPHPWENVTGIKHAKVTIKLSKSCRIPLGSTPFYLAGFFGAIYDGSGMPEGAIACHIPKMDPGLKMEAAIFLEFQDPIVVNGRVGFWVHLRRLNFGINGQFEALNGVVDADACVALYNNGSAFHGHFLVLAELGLAIKGGFIIDIWRDYTGPNFTADASASIGLTRGSIYKGRFIKIPRKTRWLFELFTNLGKFSNEKKGATTGVKIVGKKYGLGFVGRKFVIGNLGKYKLKQAPIIIPNRTRSRSIIEGDTPLEYLTSLPDGWKYIDPDLVLNGDEVITIVAAVDSGNYDFHEGAMLRALTIEKDGAGNPTGYIIDTDVSHYESLEGDESENPEDKLDESVYNMFARLWVNEEKRENVVFAFPPLDDDKFQYMVFAGLKPPTTNITVTTDEDTVIFNGSIENFQKDIRTVYKNVRNEVGDITGRDTVMMQKMKLRLYYSTLEPMPNDSGIVEDYASGFIDIPLNQFENYDKNDTSLINGNEVYYDAANKRLVINNLKWPSSLGTPGRHELRAAVEIIDFVTDDGMGNKTVLDESDIENAMAMREDPVQLINSETGEVQIINIENTMPMTAVTGFNATSSAVDSSWNGTDESRSIFLHWNRDENPSVHGYKIEWYPSGMPSSVIRVEDPNDSTKFIDSTISHVRTMTVGQTDHYTINIPLIDSTVYVRDSVLAEDSTEVIYYDSIVTQVYESVTFKVNDDTTAGAPQYIYDTVDVVTVDTVKIIESKIVYRPQRLWGGQIDTTYFFADNFDVVIVPMRSYDTTVTETNWRETGAPRDVIYRKKDYAFDLSDTITGVELGKNKGDNSRNKFKISFKNSDGSDITAPVVLPLNGTGKVKAQIEVEGFASGDADPSNHGEIYAQLVNFPDSIPEAARPSVGAGEYIFDIDGNIIERTVTFTPVKDSLTCAEAFSNGCEKRKIDSLGNYDSTTFNSCQCIDSIAETVLVDSTSSKYLDPNYPDNVRPELDPCGGNPDSLYRIPTPFGTYTVNIYAINNGQRALPVEDRGSAESAIYKQVQFKVAPTEPLIHGIHPTYVLYDREDTLSLSVSDIYDVNSVEVRAEFKNQDGSSGVHIFSDVIVEPMHDSYGNSKWHLGHTNAQYLVKIPTKSLSIATTEEAEFNVYVVNKAEGVGGEMMETVSNEKLAHFIYNPNEIECPDEYGVYDKNADYLMDWIGNYPQNPSIGDTMTIYFSELHDLNADNYNVELWKTFKDGAGNLQKTIIPTQIVNIDYWGMNIVLNKSDLPNYEDAEYWELVTTLNQGEVDNSCKDVEWGIGHTFNIHPPREYEIVAHAVNNKVDGFTIQYKSGSTYKNLNDDIFYEIGIDPSRWPVTGGTKYEVNSSNPEVVYMANSDWVTASVYDKNGDNKRVLKKFIEIDNTPILINANGDTLASKATVYPGDKLYIVSRKPVKGHDWKKVKVNDYYITPAGDKVQASFFEVTKDFNGTVYLETWSQTVNVDSLNKFSVTENLDGRARYDLTVETFENNLHAITISSAKLQKSLNRIAFNYPLLLRLDSTVVPGIDTIISKPFHFRSSSLLPLDFEVESGSLDEKNFNVWINIDTLDPGRGDNTIYLVSNNNFINKFGAPWENYSAVWHCENPQFMMDATGAVPTIDVSSEANRSSAVISSGFNIHDGIMLDSKQPLSIKDGGVTFSSWIKLDTLTGTIGDEGVVLFSYVNSDSTVPAELKINKNMSISFTINGNTVTTINNALEKGEWLNVAATYGWYHGDKTGRVYINGLLIEEKGLGNGEGRILYDPQGKLWIAGDGSVTFPGDLDEIRVAPAERAADLISLDYYTQRRRNDFFTVSNDINAVSYLSDPNFRVVPEFDLGDAVFADTGSWVMESMPSHYAGRTIVKMPYSRRDEESDSIVTLKLNNDAEIIVMIDSRFNPPAFLQDWESIDQKALVTNKVSQIPYEYLIFRKGVSANQKFTIGGARPHNSVYNLPWITLIGFKKDENHEIASVAGYPYTTVSSNAEEGELFYSDREYEITSLPEELDGGYLIRTSNSFKADTVKDFITFRLNKRSDINILLDTNYSAYPSFIYKDGWKPKSSFVNSTNGKFQVFSRTAEAGVVTIPAPKDGEGEGNRASYAVIIKKNISDSIIENLYPAEYEIGILDTGVQLYTDSSWFCTAVSQSLRHSLFIRTAQADFHKNEKDFLKFELNKSGWIYCVLDQKQTTPPEFINSYDDNYGGWQFVGNDKMRSSAPGSYKMYRRRFDPGVIAFDAVRSGGSIDNDFNYLFIFKQFSSDTIPVISDKEIIIHVTNGDTIFTDEVITIEDISATLDSLLVIKNDLISSDCDTTTFTVTEPVTVYLGVDPNFDESGTFLKYDNWTITTESFGFNDPALPDYEVWKKQFPAGTIKIPGVHCDKYQDGVYNFIIFVEFLNEPVHGYRTKRLAVRGFGENRSASSQNYMLSNLDVKYAYNYDLSSRSWKMNITAQGGTQGAGDTLSVLSAFNDTLIVVNDTTIYKDSVVVIVDDSLILGDLMPVLINADSVMVNAQNLEAQGVVRVSFTNKSAVSIEDEFVVVLFEDRDQDYLYNDQYDTYLGRAIVRGIESHEYKVYQIEIDGTLEYPERALFAFIDESDWVDEFNEINNIVSSQNICNSYEKTIYSAESSWFEDSSIIQVIPQDVDSVIPCYLQDTNGDSIVDENDDVALLFISNFKVNAINESSFDTLFPPFQIDGNDNIDILVTDITGNGRPEIVVGSVIYNNNGTEIWDARDTLLPTVNLDINRDNRVDSVSRIDSFTVIYSGVDNALLYVSPFNSWTGIQGELTRGVLAQVVDQDDNCYDVSLSYMRSEIFATDSLGNDSVNVTVRLANAANGKIDKSLEIELYEVINDTTETLIGTKTSSEDLFSDQWIDITFVVVTKNFDEKVYRLVADRKNCWFEANEDNNEIENGE